MMAPKIFNFKKFMKKSGKLLPITFDKKFPITVKRIFFVYGKKGKEDTTVGMILNHSAGLPALKTQVKEGGFFDWDYMVELLENEEPFWIPGEETGYHMMTTGWLIGELVRRVSGKSLGQFFNDEVSEPYNLDYWIGLPESEDERVAKVTPFKPSPSDKPSGFATAFRTDPTSMQRLSLTNTGGYDYNAKETYRAEIGGVGGITCRLEAVGRLRHQAPRVGDHVFGPVAGGAVEDFFRTSGRTLREGRLSRGRRHLLPGRGRRWHQEQRYFREDGIRSGT